MSREPPTLGADPQTTDVTTRAASLARHTQTVLQGAFVVSKAVNDPDLVRIPSTAPSITPAQTPFRGRLIAYRGVVLPITSAFRATESFTRCSLLVEAKSCSTTDGTHQATNHGGGSSRSVIPDGIRVINRPRHGRLTSYQPCWTESAMRNAMLFA